MKTTLKEKAMKNSFWVFSSSIINKIGALVFSIILARLLMPEKYGMYSIVLSTALIFLAFADLGLNRAVLRYMSFAIFKQKKKINSYYRYLFKLKFIFTICSSILLIIFSYPLAIYVFKNKALFTPFLVAAFYIFVLAFEGFYINIFYSIEKTKYIALKEFLNQFLRIAISLFIFYFIASSYHLVGLFVGFILIALFLILICLFYLNKILPELFLKKKERINKKKIRKFIGFATIACISGIVFSYIDSIMLGIFLLPSYVGYYRVAASIVFNIIGLTTFINIFLPIFVKIEKSKLERVFNKVVNYLSIIIIPLIFGLLLFGKYFIELLYGPIYLPSLLPFYFLCLLIFPVTFGAGLFSLVFTAREKIQILAKISAIICVINIILNLILIKSLLLISPIWATAGAAIATLISWFFYFFASLYYIKKEVKIKITLFSNLVKPLFATLIMTLILLFSFRFIESMNIILALFIILLGALIYFILMFIFKGITKEDILALRLLIKKKNQAPH